MLADKENTLHIG